MGRQVAEVAPGRSPPGASVLFGILSILPGGLGRRDLLLEVFQGELELRGIEALGFAAELGSNQLPDHQLQPLALGISLLEGALEVIALQASRALSAAVCRSTRASISISLARN